MIIDKIYSLVTGVVVNKHCEHLILKRSARSSHFAGKWQLPEGKIETGEKPEEALKREVMEELQTKILDCDFVNILILPFIVGGKKMLVMKLIYKVELSGSKFILSSEHSQYRWVSAEELSKLPTAPGTIETVKLM